MNHVTSGLSGSSPNAVPAHEADSASWLDFDRVLELTIAFCVAVTLLGVTLAVAGQFRVPQLLAGSLLAATLYGMVIRQQPSLHGARPKWAVVFAIILVAMVFRLPAYNYVLGGQDEGVYVNFAHHLENSSKLAPNDKLGTALRNTPYFKTYLGSNSFAGGYLPGVYRDGTDPTRLEFQFYAAFPVWMAAFDGIAGDTNGVYALTALALLSIVLFYRLVLLITQSQSAALLGGLLLATNPLHAFFSKFPVTEVPTLAFSLAGFLLLAAFARSPAENRRSRMLWLSVLAFACAFATRISGFMIIPFVIGLAGVTLLVDGDASRRFKLQLWAMAMIVVFAVSAMYGLTWSAHYSRDIYQLSFAPLLGRDWRTRLFVISLVTIAAWWALAVMCRKAGARNTLTRAVMPVLQFGPVVTVGVAIVLNLIKVYQLGWTERFITDPWLGARWDLAGHHWKSAAISTLWAIIIFMGPFTFALFLAFLGRRTKDTGMLFLKWFAAGFFAYAVVLKWYSPYNPYYARYMVSEVVPVALLLAVCAWGTMTKGWRRTVVATLLATTVVYGSAISARQIGKIENEGAYASLERLMRHVNPNDVVMLDLWNGSAEVIAKTTIAYTFNRQVVSINHSNLINDGYQAALGKLGDEVYLLTSDAGPEPTGFDYIASSRFRVMAYKHDHSVPRTLVTRYDQLLRLYRQRHSWTPVGVELSFAKGGKATQWLAGGWSHPEAWGTWSIGNRAILSLPTDDLSASPASIRLRITARVLVSAKHPLQRVNAWVGETQIGRFEARYPITTLTRDIPIPASALQGKVAIEVRFELPDAVSPKDLGSSEDSRVLALGVESAELLASGPDLPARETGK